VLWRAEADTFRIEVARSFAPYILECLDEASREFLAPAVTPRAGDNPAVIGRSAATKQSSA
jgi:hypothetical protein